MVNVTYIKFNNLQNTWHSFTNTSDVIPGIAATNIYNNNNNNDSNQYINGNRSYFNHYHQHHHHLNHNLTSSDVILLIEDQHKNGNRLLNGSSFAIGVLVCAFLTLLIGCCCICNWYNQYPNSTTNISGTKKRQRQRQQRLINANNNNNDNNINNNSNSRNNDITLFSRSNALRAAIISATTTTTRNSRNNNNNNDVAMETATTIINNDINSNNNNNSIGGCSSDDNMSSSNYDHTTSTFFNTTFREYFRDIGTTNDRRRRERRNRNSCNQNDRSNRRNVNNNNNGGFLNFTDDDDEDDEVNDRDNYGRQEHSGDPTRDIVRHFEFDVESLPSYTIVSGLPTYDDALEQIRKPGLLITTPNISKLFENYKQQQEQLNLNQSVDNIQTKLSGQDSDSQDTSITIEGSTGNSIQNSQQLPPTIVITNPNDSGATNSSTSHNNDMIGNNLTQIIELGPEQLNLLSQKRLSVQIAFSAPSMSRSQLNLANGKLNVHNNDYPLLHGRTPSLSVRHLQNRRASDFLRNSIYIKNIKRNTQHRGSLC